MMSSAYREDVFQHTIPLKPECQKGKPFRQKLRQINPKLAPIIKKELEKMLAAGIIAPTRHSTWCSNLVVVRKKNGSIRICIDFRNLNIACQKDNYPLLQQVCNVLFCLGIENQPANLCDSYRFERVLTVKESAED